VFEIIRFKGAKYAFKSCYNKYLSYRPGIGINANATSISRYEVFSAIPADGWLMLVAWNGEHVQMKKNGKVICKGRRNGEKGYIRVV
jgi:hypothetical protein